MTSTASTVEIGASFGPYEILRTLGRGPTGTVYLAGWTERSTPVALKVFGPSLTHPGRFLGDCELVAAIDQGVLPLYEWGEIDGVVYVSMRHVDGSDLETVLQQGPLPPEQTQAVVDQVAAALHAAHSRGVVHRDLKPRNVLLEAGTHRVFVSDFGVAGPVSTYSAPERADGMRLDGRADIYSLGRVVADCAEGDDLDAVVAKATADDPAERYTTALELAEACRLALPRSRPAQPAPVPPPVLEAPEEEAIEHGDIEDEPFDYEEGEEPSGRRRRLLFVVAGLLAIGAIAAGLAAVLGGGGKAHQATPPVPPPAPPHTRLATAQQLISARVNGVGAAVGAAAGLPLASPPLYDEVAFSAGTGVRYRSSPDQWCGSAPASDPCWNSVIPGAGASEGQTLRVYCYTEGAAVHGNTWWAMVKQDPAAYIPATFLKGSHLQPPANAPLC